MPVPPCFRGVLLAASVLVFSLPAWGEAPPPASDDGAAPASDAAAPAGQPDESDAPARRPASLKTSGATTAPKPAARAADAESAVGKRRKTSLLPISFAVTDNAATAATRVGYIIEQSIRQSRRFELIEPLDLFDPAGHQERSEMADRGNDALVFGRKSYEGLEEGLGLESFDRAISSFQESALWENFRGYTRALAMRILVKWSDDQATAKKELGTLLLLDPKAEFPKDLLSPDLTAEINRQRDALTAVPRTSFDIASDPVSARIYVDGVFRGTTPGSVKELLVGDHLLSLAAPGYEVLQQQIHVTPGGTLTVALKPAEKAKPFVKLARRLSRGLDKADEPAAAQALGHLGGADEILSTGVSRHAGILDIVIHRFQTRDGHAAAVFTILDLAENDPDFAAKIDKRMSAVLGPDHPHCEKGAPCTVVEVEGGGNGRALTPVQQGAIATVVIGGALIATGIGLGVDAYLQEKNFLKVPQTDPALLSKARAVSTPALASDLCNGVGIVSLGIWAYLAFGVAAHERAEIPTPSSIDSSPKDSAPGDSKPDEKDKKKDDDPFETRTPGPLPAPSLAFMAGPQNGGFSFTLLGSF